MNTEKEHFLYRIERRGGRIGEKSVMLLLPKNRPVQHTFEI
jgi:hypothetical protein